MTYRQEAESVLEVWRAVERALDEAEPGSQEAEELQAEALRLRDEYQRRVALARQAHVGDAGGSGLGTGHAEPGRS